MFLTSDVCQAECDIGFELNSNTICQGHTTVITQTQETEEEEEVTQDKWEGEVSLE